ncbi:MULTISPECIES: hypothetical protein [unclassified Paenibacillus]|uniref:hypothetical protein n=1 Tax=unclassified Paenibacillus TaxID=185978 RepID=UPI002117A089|nr:MULTISPECIES: hypothetical protein [unclassified Paenibacillus]
MMYKGYVIRLICCPALVLLVASGCGQNQQNSNPNQQSSNQQNVRPVDTELQYQMKMYQDIRQEEFKQQEQIRKNEKQQLKTLQKQQEEMLKQELEFQEKIRKAGDSWSIKNKEEKSSGKQETQDEQDR